MYKKSMKEMFKQMHTKKNKSLSLKQEVQKLMTEIGSGWYLKKNSKGLSPLRRFKKVKKHKIRRIKSNIYI